MPTPEETVQATTTETPTTVETPVVESVESTPAPVPAWDGRRDSLSTLPYWSTLPQDVQTSLMAGLDTVETRWSESTAAAERAERERVAAQAIADLLDARDTGSVDIARDMVLLRNQVESLTAERNAAAADYESKLRAATDGHAVTQAELNELRAARAELETAKAAHEAKIAEQESLISTRDSELAAQREKESQLITTSIVNHLWETRPDLRSGDEVRQLEVQARFFDILVNPLVDGDMQKAYKYLAVEMPPPPKPDTVPDAVALMNNATTATASLADTLKNDVSPVDRVRQIRRQMELDALRQDNM